MRLALRLGAAQTSRLAGLTGRHDHKAACCLAEGGQGGHGGPNRSLVVHPHGRDHVPLHVAFALKLQCERLGERGMVQNQHVNVVAAGLGNGSGRHSRRGLWRPHVSLQDVYAGGAQLRAPGRHLRGLGAAQK